MRRARSLWLAGSAALSLSLVAGCSSGDSGNSQGSATAIVEVDIATEPMSDGDAAALDAAVQDALRAADPDGTLAPGTWIGVWDPARGVFTKAYGRATLDGEPADLDQRLRIGSVTKTFTAVAVLLLVDDGALALDDTVESVLPELATEFPAYAPLTIEQLLRMQSGIADYLNRPDGILTQVVAEPQRQFVPDELITSAVSGDVEDPGTIGYSSTNFVVLEEIVNEVAGTPLQEVIAERITGPLGMANTALQPYDETSIPGPAARGYATGPEDGYSGCRAEFALMNSSVPENTDTSDWSQSSTRGAGGMYSTLQDLGIWAASLSGNILLSPELQAKRIEITPNDYLPYGMGILQVSLDNGTTYLGHEGDGYGYQAYALLDQQSGTAVAVMNNTCGSSGLMDDLIVAADPREATADAEQDAG